MAKLILYYLICLKPFLEFSNVPKSYVFPTFILFLRLLFLPFYFFFLTHFLLLFCFYLYPVSIQGGPNPWEGTGPSG